MSVGMSIIFDRSWLNLSDGLLDLNSVFGSDLILWISASQSTLYQSHTGTGAVGDGDVVGYIGNLATVTGSAHDLTQSTTANKVTWRASVAALNNQPAFDFGGDDYYQKALAAMYAQPLTILAVFKSDNTTSGHNIVNSDDTLNQVYVAATDTEYEISAGTPVAGGTFDTNPHALSVVFNGASSVLRVDGVSTVTGNPGTNGTDGITFGLNRLLTFGWAGEICELAIIDAGATAAQLNLWLAAMQSQYGISYTEIT